MSEIRIFQSSPAKRTLICKKKLWKSAIFHSIKLPFDAEVAEKNLEWYLMYMYLSQNNGLSLQIQFPVFEVNKIIIRILILEISRGKLLCALKIYIFLYLKFCKCWHSTTLSFQQNSHLLI